MPQSQYKSNSELKFLARLQTGRCLGLLVLTVILNFIIRFTAINLISSLIPAASTIGYIINYIFVFIAQVVASVLNVGMSFIFMKSACNMPATINDLFYGFKNNLTKALKISAFLAFIESICLIPADILSLQTADMISTVPIFSEYSMNDLSMMIASGSINQYEILEAYSILTNILMRFYIIIIICTVISIIITLPFFPAYYMILDFPDWNVGTILKKCIEIMKGNKVRLFMLYLSFIPIFLLSIFTCGLALIWVIPYMNMAKAAFYLDIMSVRNKNLN